MKRLCFSLKRSGCSFLFCITIMLTLLFLCCLKCYASEDTGETFTVGFKQGERNSNFSECDATDDHIFFAYDEGNLVDAYDYDGNFQFTLFFEDYSNGGFRIECHNNQLYIKTKKHAVFVFDGSSLVQEMYYSSAADLGFNATWFLNRGNIQASKTTIYRVNDHGDKTAIAKTPQVIAENLPLILISEEANRIINIVVAIVTVLLVVIIWVIAIIRIGKTTKTKPDRLG